MVKPILAVLFPSLVGAQHRPVGVPTGGSCGPGEEQFDVVTNKDQHPVVQAEPGKALVYVIEDIERGPTMRIGLDGVWVDAVKGESYFFFSVDEGDHQLCTKWQSGTFKKTAQRIGSATAPQRGIR